MPAKTRAKIAKSVRRAYAARRPDIVGRFKAALAARGMSGAAQGHRFTPEQRERLAAAKRASPPNRRPTALERSLVGFLRGCGLQVERWARFGPYTVDAYCPALHTAFEADGDYWHSLPGRREGDRRRDAALLRGFGLPVVRLGEDDIAGLPGVP